MRFWRLNERGIILLLSAKLVLVGLFLTAEPLATAQTDPAKPAAKTSPAPAAKKKAPPPAKKAAPPKKATPPGAVRLPSTGGTAQPAGPAMLRLLNERREEVRRAEARLKRQRAELDKLRAELDKRLARLNKLQKDIQTLLAQAKQRRSARIAHLTQVLSNMQPEAAARLFEALELDLVVAVIMNMQGRQAGRIMARVRPKRAAQISTRLAEIKRRQQTRVRPRPR